MATAPSPPLSRTRQAPVPRPWAQATVATGQGPRALVAGDFTGDGQLDLATANADSNDVSVLVGNGDGTFVPQASLPAGAGPAAIVVADFNSDGRTDLAVANSKD